ncbi:MAG: hypothetical protein ACU84H_00815 [Gammaproteobacteria bacterium]
MPSTTEVRQPCSITEKICMKRILFPTAIGALIVAVVAYWVFTGKLSTDGRSAPVVVGDEDRMHAVLKDVAELKDRVAQLSKEVATLRRVTLQSPDKPAAPPSQGAATVSQGPSVDPGDDDFEQMLRERNEATARLQAQRLEQFAAIESVFASESPDPNWSGETSAWMRQTLADKDIGKINASNAECRTSLCRLEINIDNRSSDQTSMMLAHKLGDRLPRAEYDKIDEGNGTTTVILYLFREGYNPPPLTP